MNKLQELSKIQLEKSLPDIFIRRSGNTLLFNVPEVDSKIFDAISDTTGMYSHVKIRRSGKNLLIILMF